GSESFVSNEALQEIQRSLTSQRVFDQFRDPRDGSEYVAAFAVHSEPHSPKGAEAALVASMPIVVAATPRDVLYRYELTTIACCIAVSLIGVAAFFVFVQMLLRRESERLRALTGA